MFNKIVTVCVLLLAIVAVAFAQNSTAATNSTNAPTQAPTTASGTGFVQPEVVMLLLSAVAAFFR